MTDGWLEPLLAAIEEDPTRVVLPIVDLLNPTNFKFTKAMISKGAFDLSLFFKWEYFDWSYWDVEENNVKLFE